MNPYKLLVEKYEKLLELKRSAVPKQAPFPAQNLQDELLNSSDFSSFNTKYTTDDEKKPVAMRQKSSTDFETDTTSSGIFEEETSTKATQTEESPSLLFSIADGDACKFSLNMVYDDATPASKVESRFKDQPKYQELFKEIFSVLKKAADNKEEGEKLPLLDEKEKVEVPDTSAGPDFDTQSVVSESVMSENSVVSECVTKTERRKAKSHKKQAVKEELEFGPPSAVKMVAGKLVTPYNRLALDLSAITAKKKARRSSHRSKDKYASGRDSSVCSNASSISNQATTSAAQNDNEPEETSTLKRNKRGRRPRELLSYSTLGATEWSGDSMTVYNRNSANPSNFYCRPGGQDNSSGIEFKTSAASHELKKLKKLDMSYAEVLRRADRSARHRNRKS